MLWNQNTDVVDPLERAYTRYLRRLVILIVLLVLVLGLVYMVGVPHVQWTYTYSGARPSDGWVRSPQKLDAWYMGPWGWQHVTSGEHGQVGCPALLLIPIEDCQNK